MTPLVDEHWLWRALNGGYTIEAVAELALRDGDYLARCAVSDYAQEFWEADVCPFEVGQCYLIQTVTLYYVGRVSAIKGAFLVLEEASWVHWTGRLSRLCASKDFASGFRAGERRPRVEFLGDNVGVNLAAIVAFAGGDWKLPRESS